MNADHADGPSDDLILEYQLDAPPEKVWRAISVPGLREVWLPGTTLVDPEPTILSPGEAIRYRMREDEPPFRESASHATKNGWRRAAKSAAGGMRRRSGP